MDKDSESVVREWLAEYKSLPESSIPNYAEAILKRENILEALLKLFNLSSFRNSSSSVDDLIQPICHQLFEFYRSGFPDLKNFAINLFPAIIFHHLVSSFEFTDSTSTDTLLLSIYTIENTIDSESPGIEIPQLGYSSIYHDPMSGIFSEQILNTPGRRFYRLPALPNYQVIIPSNRFQILTKVLTIYFEHIAIMQKNSHLSLCESCRFLSSSGYPWQDKYVKKISEKSSLLSRRYPLGVEFMMKMLRCVYFTMYNDCWSEAFEAAEAMQRRARKELIPKVLFLCNAILNTGRAEEEEQKNNAELGETAPFGLMSVNLTPILTRETSRRGGRWAVTAKSIKDHKWKHRNEEISGDLSRSLENPEVQIHPPKVGQSQDAEETSKTEKYSTTSPSKLMKSKWKKSAAAGGQASGASDKAKSPAPSSGEKKSKKSSSEKPSEEQENLKRSPSQRKETPSKKASPSALKKTGKGGNLQKHPSLDETSLLSTTPKQKGVSISKSSSDVARSAVGKLPHQSSSVTSYDDSVGKHDNSAGALLDMSKLDVSSESEAHDLDARSKEMIPLLTNGESPSRKSSTTQQTAL